MNQQRKPFLLQMSAEQMMARAREMTGIDIIDEAAVEPFRILHASYNIDACLHEQGAIAIEKKLLRLLCNRLRMQRDFAKHPEIAEIRISNPVFVYGQLRSGTTKIQKLLAASGDFHYLPFWRTFNPSLFTGSRSESPQPRIAEADTFIRWFDRMSPDAKLGHRFSTFEPEEESLLLEHSLVSGVFIAFSTLGSYIQWFSTQNPTVTVEYLRDMLKYLQWQSGDDKPWVLKSPLWGGLEPFLMEVFPDAHLLMTHRTPHKTVPSLFRLLDTFHAPFSDKRPEYETLRMGLVMGLEEHLKIRERSTNVKILDIPYGEVTGPSEDVAKKIYHFCGMTLHDKALQNIRNWETANPVHRLGAFTYDQTDYQLTPELINKDFASYLKFLHSTFPEHRSSQ
jgi:hypothetical protein